MLQLVPIAQLFYGKDILIDFLSFLIILIVLLYSIKFYKINKSQKKYLFLISSFSLLSISFLAKILSHFIIYYNDIDKIGIIGITYQTINQSYALVFWGLFIYRIMSVFALYLFYMMYSDKLDMRNQALQIFLLMLVAYLGQSEYYIHHLTMSFLLLINIFSLKARSGETKSITTRYLIYGFSTLLLSQVVLIFLFFNDIFYLAGEVIQLFGYLLILFGFIKVFANGIKKKRTN